MLTHEELIRKQCDLQHATAPSQVKGFRSAYWNIHAFAATKANLTQLTANKLLDLVRVCGLVIETCNHTGYRQIPVVFADGSHGLEASSIPRAMQQWAQAVCDGRLSPADAYRELEQIHPFQDGNGRVGHLIWALLTVCATGSWPMTLPPDLFQTDASPREYASAFGEVDA